MSLMKYAIDYLSKYSSSKNNLERILKKKISRLKIEKKEKFILYNSINQIMLNLEKNKYIDDNNYAISKIRLFAMQGKSKGFIKSYLIQKGIEKNILNNSLDQFEEEDPEWEKKSARIFVKKKRLENSNENSIYALSKFFLQDSLRFILIKNNISLIKIDNVYGPYDLNFNRLIPSLMLKLLFNNKDIKVKLTQQKKLIYVKDLQSVIFKTIKNKKSFNIIHIKGKNFNILKLWKSINKILHNKHKRITQNNDCYNFIETFEWYKDNLWMIKKNIQLSKD